MVVRHSVNDVGELAVHTGSLGHLTSTDAGLIIGHAAYKDDGGNALCDRPLVAFDATRRKVWSPPSGSGAASIPSVGDAVYFTDDTGTLRRVSGSGAVEWSLANVILGPVVLPDGSLVVPSTVGFSERRHLRRVSADGSVLWIWWTARSGGGLVPRRLVRTRPPTCCRCWVRRGTTAPWSGWTRTA